MSAKKATYLDSSAIVKLVVREPESLALRHFLRKKDPLVSSTLARTEVRRALLQLGETALNRDGEVFARIDLIRVNDKILSLAGTLMPPELRSLDAIHLATARLLGSDLARFVAYDDRLRSAASDAGWKVFAPEE
ncbi:MAG: type II toxin-antitoxin system VapC family toxin [Actinomycetota bacterium]